MKPKITFGEKCADAVARFGGSWAFIFCAIIFLSCWMMFNIYSFYAFDKPPFILLNLVLSFVAAFQAPFLLMAANRQSQLDRKRDEADFILDKDTNRKINKILEMLSEKK